MKERVETLVCSELGRHAERQAAVYNGEHREHAGVQKAYLFTGGGVGDDGGAVGLRTGARSRSYGNERQRLEVNGNAPARTRRDEVPVIFAVGRGERYGLGCVNDRTSPERHHIVAMLVPCERYAGVDRLQRGIGAYARIYHGRRACRGQRLIHSVIRTALYGRAAL